MKKPEDYIAGKIKDCTNTNSIFNTRKYVEFDDVIRIIREVMIDCEEANGAKTSNERERLIHFLTEIMKDKDSITIEQQVDTYLINN